MDLLSKAIIFAAKAHDGMRRKNSDLPYILHPLEACQIVSTMTSNQEVIAASVLHDVVEDTTVTIEEIHKEFGDYIYELVSSETENKREEIPANLTWKLRKEESLEVLKNTNDLNVLKLWVGDKLSNVRSLYREYLKKGDLIWEMFNQKDSKEQEWYYTNVVKHTSKLQEFDAWKELDSLVKKIFNLKEE